MLEHDFSNWNICHSGRLAPPFHRLGVAERFRCVEGEELQAGGDTANLSEGLLVYARDDCPKNLLPAGGDKLLTTLGAVTLHETRFRSITNRVVDFRTNW